MLFTGLGRSVLGETVHSAWVPPSAYGLRRYSRPRAQFLPIRTSQPVNNIYIFQQVLCILLQVLIVRFYLNTNASVNSTCAQPPPPRALAFFLPWMANSRGWGLLSCQIPRGGDEKRGQMPRPPSTLQHFSLIAQSNSAVLSILMCKDFTPRRHAPVYGFSVGIKLLTLKLIERCKVICYE